MPPFLLALVLGAALLHATWNAMLRSSGDRYLSMIVLNITAGLICLPFLAFVPLPPLTSWFYIVLSALIHVSYSLFLVELYRHGDLGQTYPIARGSSPLLVALGALFFSGEHLHPLTVVGMVLVSAGIITLSGDKKEINIPLVLVGLATGLMIASYTVVDGLGSRRTGNSLSYSLWMFAIYGPMMLPVYWLRRDKRTISWHHPEMQKAVLSGCLSLIGYCVIIWAITYNPMGPISALRETSVLFAALIGWFFMKEKLTPRRLAACAIIVLGAVCLH